MTADGQTFPDLLLRQVLLTNEAGHSACTESIYMNTQSHNLS